MITAEIKNGKINVSDKYEFAKLLARFEGKRVTIKIDNAEHKRTPTQNNAMHLYFKLIAEALTAAGFDAKATFEKAANVPVTADMIKDGLWKPVMREITTKQSTSELTTKEVGEIYEIINQHTAEQFGLHIPFPDFEYGREWV